MGEKNKVLRLHDFELIHVIKKLKQILSSWWNVDVVFVNEHGHLHNLSFKPQDFHGSHNYQFLASETGRKSLTTAVAHGLAKATKTQQAVTAPLENGTHIAIAPIVIEGELMGSVVGLSFLVAEDNAPKTNKEPLRVIGPQERPHFLNLVEMIAKEVISLHNEITSRESRILELSKEMGSRYKYDNMIGKSAPMQKLYDFLEKIKTTQSTILIQGENGTGKELIAKSIHHNSPRKNRPFVTVNCSSFNDNLLGSELFGHAKGSFTGAHQNKRGLFEVAHTGTFFLDEVGDTSPTMQVQLLRVLQEGTFVPVGAVEAKKVDVRVISATNKDLKQMVEKGEFREDLYYRLNVINLKAPALRERKEDIPLLAEYFLNSAQKKSQNKKVLSNRSLAKLFDYSWPGNVRELENEVERMLVLSGEKSTIDVDALSDKILAGNKGSRSGITTHNVGLDYTPGLSLKSAVESLEKRYIEQALRASGWNKSRVAKELGISRAGLILKVDKYQLEKRKLKRS